jgi:hypothetical protein
MLETFAGDFQLQMGRLGKAGREEKEMAGKTLGPPLNFANF